MTAPIIMTLHEGKDGLDIAEAEFASQRYTASSRNGVTRKLARALVEAGAPDCPVEARGTNGRLRYTAKSLHAFARWTITEPDAGRLQLQRYHERPDFLCGKTQDGASDGGQREHAPAQKAA